MSVRVEGRPLTPVLPYGLKIETEGDDFKVIEPTDRSFAGRLVLPFVATGGLRMFDLDVPSSGTFTPEDLEHLWLAGQELATWRSRLALTSTDDAYAQPEPIGRTEVVADWHALELCAFEARRLLSAWPTRTGRELRWVPVGVGGGFEDLGYTEREVARAGYLSTSGDKPVVTRSARWFGKGERITLSAIASLAQEVSGLLRSTLSADDLRQVSMLAAPIEQVAAIAGSVTPRADPDASSWPPAFVRFASACIRVLTELLARQRGSQAVPLLDTDELYEAWLAVAVRDLISEQLGGGTEVSKGAIASWETDATTIDLRVKPSISRKSSVGQHEYRALVANTLVPDVVLSATRGAFTELAVLDAKAWVKMLPEDVLSETAKYLYGIRRMGSDQLPAIASVQIVSCAPQPNLMEADDAKVGFVHATPTAGTDALRSAVQHILDDLAAAIERREQEASLLT
ncbi:MAG TPA: hypothetical protein VHX87_07025 [Galbitalea sp.]|nr:hypothetical protein [Galbitalea sp.]